MLSQIEIFGYACLFGAGLGIFYDVFRIFRLFFTCKILHIFIQDVIYFLILGISSFLFILSVNYGEIRFYILAGETIGWVVYYIVLGQIVYKLFSKFSKVIKRFVNKICCLISKILSGLGSKMRVILLKKSAPDEKI